MAASAYDQAQSIAQRFQRAQEQQGRAAQSVGGGFNIGKPAPQFSTQQSSNPRGNIFTHMQSPHVQNAMAVIGKFLSDIGHPLAGHFTGQGGSVMGGVSPAAKLAPVGQSTNQGVSGIMNMYAQGGTGQVPKTGGYAAPGATIPGVPRK